MAKAIGKISIVDRGMQNVGSLKVTKEIIEDWHEEEFVVAIGLELEDTLGRAQATLFADTVMRVAFRCPNIDIAVVMPPSMIAKVNEAIKVVRKAVNKEIKKIEKTNNKM